MRKCCLWSERKHHQTGSKTLSENPIAQVTQIFMMSVLFNPMVESGIAPDTAWRLAMIVPAVMFLIVAISLKLLCWDTPTARPVLFSCEPCCES